MSKTVIVTGGSSGIGAEISSRFSQDGYQVVVAGRNATRTNAVASELSTAVAWVGDLKDSAACDALVNYAVSEYDGLDVLINNAGVIHRQSGAHTSDQVWRETLSVNLDIPFFLSRAAIPHLLKTHGAIVNIASEWGIRGGQKAAAYCASKGGLILLTKAMALDHAREGVRINAICPGDVDTPMLEMEAAQLGIDYRQAMRENNADSPTGRITTPEEIAALAAYLCSSQAAQITGAAIPIDGGNAA